MIRSGLIAVVLMAPVLASPVVAQNMPAFDDTAGFSVTGVLNGVGLLVESAGNSFVCEIDEGPEDAYYALKACVPIVGATQLEAAARDTMRSAPTEQEFLAGLSTLPETAFMTAIEQALRKMGCTMDMSGGDEPFLTVLGAVLSESAGFEAPLSEKAINAIGDMTEDAGETLMRSGRVTVNRETRMVTLEGCE